MFALLKQSDARAVRQVLRGRRDQFDTLVKRYLPAVYAVSYAQLRNHADAEDVAQEAFLTAFTSLHTLREPHKFEGWVVSMARRIAVHLRQKRQSENEANGVDSREAVVIPDAARDELRQLLRQEIDRLDGDDREVLLMHYFTGKSAGEIAVALSIGREAAKKRLQRARQQLSDNMLRRVEDETKPHSEFEKQRNAIAGLIAVAAVPWEVALANTYFSLASAGATKVAALIGLAGVLVGGGVYLAAKSPGSMVTEKVPATTADMQHAPADANEVATEVTEPAKTSSEVNAVQTEDAGVVGGVPAVETSLNGVWKVCDNLGLLSDIRVIHVVESDGSVALHISEKGAPGMVLASGMIADGQIDLPDVTGGEIAGLSGTVSENDTFTIRGEISIGGEVSNAKSLSSLEITLTRLTERDLAEIEIQDRRIAEIEQLATALKAYAAANANALPAALSDLSPKFLSASQLAESGPSRRISYAPDGIQLLSNWVEGYAQLSSHVEKLRKLEADRRAGWPGFPYTPDLLAIEYSTPPMTLLIRSLDNSNGRRADSNGPLFACPRQSPDSELENVAQRESCANNIKQLGLVLKMFQHEDAERRLPGGWASTVPDYLLDTQILTCPGLGEDDVPDRTVSYDFLFPTLTEAELAEIGEAVTGPGGASTMLSQIPLVVENSECSKSGGSHVLFADGHAELLEAKEWETRVAPFADYSEKL